MKFSCGQPTAASQAEGAFTEAGAADVSGVADTEAEGLAAIGRGVDTEVVETVAVGLADVGAGAAENFGGVCVVVCAGAGGDDLSAPGGCREGTDGEPVCRTGRTPTGFACG